MSSNPEIPNHIESDDYLERDITLESLVKNCIEFANSDYKYENYERLRTGWETSWMTDSGTEWKVNFAASHKNIDNSQIWGHSFDLKLSVRQFIGSLSGELRRHAAINKQPLPEDKYIDGVEVTYKAFYNINEDGVLRSGEYRFYDIYHNQTNVHKVYEDEGIDEDFDDDYDDIDEDGNILISICLANHRTSSFKIDSNKFTQEQLDEQFRHELEEDAHIRHAQRVFEILEHGDEGNFDLADIFPPEVLIDIGRLP